ncbi:MAG TPA: hypothetical protein VMA77_11765 [Solirubrobacteraceae bacterium]|nr:hypothetical protein [Solirubrobacteraceae bacterium]
MAELRAQARAVRVKGLWEGCPSVVLLEVTNRDAPRASVVHAVPVEARVRDAEPARELLLFVKDGLLESLEVVDYGSSSQSGLPAVDELEGPITNSTQVKSRQPRSLPN